MLYVKNVNEVQELIKEHFKGYSPESRIVALTDSFGRVTSQDIFSKEDIPGFDRSTVDGYAVISEDTFGSSETVPSQLRLLREIQIGVDVDFEVQSGYAAYIPTGGKLPRNADSVVMIEYTENIDDGFVYINRPVSPGNNIIFTGDDCKKCDLLIKSNTIIGAKEIGALAAAGYDYVNVKDKLKVGIISTGDEVVNIDFPITPAKIRDVNSYLLYASVLESGVEPKLYGIVPDNFEKIRSVTDLALNENDIVLVSGGSSVGNMDQTAKVIESFGEPGILVHGIAMKPGKPTIVAKVKDKALIGMPGHPVSAFFVFKMIVSHLICVLYDVQPQLAKTVKATITVNYPSNTGREEYLPVKLSKKNEGYEAEPVFTKSGLITTLTGATGFVKIDRRSEGIKSGSEVEVILF